MRETAMLMADRHSGHQIDVSSPLSGKVSHTVVFTAGWLVTCCMAVACIGANERAIRRSLLASQNEARATDSANDIKARKDSLAPDGTLQGTIAYALKNSPELEALFYRWQASVSGIAQARRLPDPVISYAYYIQNVETRVGPQRHRLSLKQSFPWPTKLTKGADAAALRAQSLQRRFDARAIAIAAAVEEKYWSLWALDTTRKIHQDHLAVLQGLSESSNALLTTNQIELADQQQIDLAVARLEDLLQEIEAKIVQTGAVLKGIIGAPQGARLTVVSSPSAQELSLDEKTLLASVRNHPSLHSFEDLARASEAEAGRETANRYPSFSLGVDWIETAPSDNPAVRDNGKDAVLVGVGVSIPLWQTNYRESAKAHIAESRALRADGQAAADRAVARFHEVRSELQNARRRIQLYKDTLVPQAETVFESVIGAYTSGKSSIAAVLLAQRDLLELRAELVEIQADHAKGLARLADLVGHSLTTKNHELESGGE